MNDQNSAEHSASMLSHGQVGPVLQIFRPASLETGMGQPPEGSVTQLGRGHLIEINQCLALEKIVGFPACGGYASALMKRSGVLSVGSPRGKVKVDEGQSGFALIAVLGMVLIISAVLVPFSMSARLRVLTAENALRSFRTDAIGEVLTRHVAERVYKLADLGQLDAALAGAEVPCTVGNYSITVAIQDHVGLIDLNAAGIAVLDIGLQALGLPKERAASLAFAIDHYRRLDRRSDAGIQLGLIGQMGYKHAAFEDVIELQDFVDLQAISPIAIASIFTVQTGSGTLSLDAAPDPIRQAIVSRSDRILPVTASSRPRVLTVTINMLRHGEQVSMMTAIYRLSANKVAYLGSLPPSAGETGTGAFSGRSLSCGAAFERPVMTALAEVLR